MAYLFHKTHKLGLCGHVRFLPDDTSVLSAEPCNDYRIGYADERSSEFYSLTIWKMGLSHIYMENFECDDGYSDRNTGSWLFFVR